MELSAEQADDLIFSVALAAMFYDVDAAALDKDSNLHDTITEALSAIDGVILTDDERDTLRIACARVITDPTTWRHELLELVISATPSND